MPGVAAGADPSVTEAGAGAALSELDGAIIVDGVASGALLVLLLESLAGTGISVFSAGSKGCAMVEPPGAFKSVAVLEGDDGAGVPVVPLPVAESLLSSPAG